MIGEKINIFDNLPENENTVAKFNEFFNTELEGKGLVEIGDILVGGFREIFIGDKLLKIQLKLQDIKVELTDEEIVEDYNFNHRFAYEISIDNKKVGLYPSLEVVANVLGSSASTILRYVRDGIKFYGYSINKIDMVTNEHNKLLENDFKKLPIDKKRKRKNKKGSGRKSRSLYIITLHDNTQMEFMSTTKAGNFLGVSRKTVESRLKKNSNKMINGWKIIKKNLDSNKDL